MVQAHIKKMGLLALGLCLGTMATARSLPWYLQAEGTAVAPASIESAPIRPGNHRITVAVIDSGVLQDHPALQGALLPGFDMVSGSHNLRGGRSIDSQPDARDAACGKRIVSSSFRTHGTEVASLIAGNGYQNMWGVNPQAKIVPVRVFSACGMNLNDMIDGIRWSAGLPVHGAPRNANPARVINISINGGALQCRPALQNAVNEAIRAGSFVVVAAGNNFHRPLTEPANCDGVISVGAVSADNNIERYSALDPRTTIYTTGGGPALRVNRPWSDNKLRVASIEVTASGQENMVVADKGVGTSFAAPLVSGFLSLWLSHRPNLKPADWEAYIDRFVRNVNPLDKCIDCNPMGLVVRQQLVGVK